MTLPTVTPARSDTTRSDTTRSLIDRFVAVRAATEALCSPLVTEDYVVSSVADVSPTKWHLAHTSWFFETFLLALHDERYVALNPRYSFLFNSYYVQAGERHCRAQRGLVTRPTVDEVFSYRRHVDDAVLALSARLADDPAHPAWAVLELGLHHEQQHQELLVTDIKHVFWTNPIRPSYLNAAPLPPEAVTQGWHRMSEGVRTIGHAGDGFSFDNEGPAHKTYVQAFSLAHRLVTNAEFAAFIADGGYRQTALWMSKGLGCCARRQLDRAALLGAARRCLARVHAVRDGTDRPPCTGDPHQLLRGRRLRSVGGLPTSHRSGVGKRGLRLPDAGTLRRARGASSLGRRQPRHAAAVRRRLAVDTKRLCRVPGLSSVSGRDR